MVGWHHRLNGREFEQTLGDGEGQGSLVCWSMGSQRVRCDWPSEQQKAKKETILFSYTIHKTQQIFFKAISQINSFLHDCCSQYVHSYGFSIRRWCIQETVPSTISFHQHDLQFHVATSASTPAATQLLQQLIKSEVLGRIGTSPVVQWLRICPLVQAGEGLLPG